MESTSPVVRRGSVASDWIEAIALAALVPPPAELPIPVRIPGQGNKKRNDDYRGRQGQLGVMGRRNPI